MSHEEEPLYGGHFASPIRIGANVHRRAGPWSPFVHRLLDHLESRGFPGAPRARGFDERGREVLTFIEGESGGWGWHYDLATLEAVARLLREFHDASATFVPPSDAIWRMSAPPGTPEVMCHNDLAPVNTVFRGDLPCAFIDWDHAAPGTRAWDVSMALWRWTPLRGSGTWGLPAEAPRRIAAFVRAYGDLDAREALAVLPARVLHWFEFVRAGAAEREPGFLSLWSRGYAVGLLRDAEYLERVRPELEALVAASGGPAPR